MSGMRITVDIFAVWAARGLTGRSVPVGQWLVPVVASLSGAAGLIHLLVIEEHLSESLLHALLFAGLAAFQLAWAIGYGARPGRTLGWVAVAVNLGAVAFWVVSRTTGLPGWLDGGGIEPVGLADLASTVFELGIVAGLLARHWRPMQERVTEGRSISRADAGLGMAIIVLAASLLTLGAIGEIAAGGHAHADGDRHEVGPHADG